MTSATAPPPPRPLPPVLGRLMSGTFWLAFRTPIQVVLTLWQTRLILEAYGVKQSGAYGFAWGFGFLQFLLEFGIGSALQRHISDTWTRGDREAVDRTIACGMNFYAAMAVFQVAALMGVAYWALPHQHYTGDSYQLVVKLLWLQAVTAPCYGLTMVVSSVLQAARRYDFIPKIEVFVVLLRFALLWGGVRVGLDFFTVVVLQTAAQVFLSLGPAIWIMARELGHIPHFRGARLADFAALFHISFYMFLIQLSVVLADKIDTTILGFALTPEVGLEANGIYLVISKPFTQVRQTGWMLASMVMPAVASLAAACDERALDRVKYDGPRLHIAGLVPV
ncbi:lipopolysaccharide biosynthesis protein, partial [Singulisphaera rosea]